jgi:hypothetical protein
MNDDKNSMSQTNRNNQPNKGNAMNKTFRFVIVTQEGRIVSRHKKYENAERKLSALKNYRCGICGNKNKGCYICKHGYQNIVCNADHYNSKIYDCEQIGNHYI